MQNEEALVRYRELSAEHYVDVWTEPVDVLDHMAALQGMIAAGVPGSYPKAFAYDRSGIAPYISDWTVFRSSLVDVNMDRAVQGRVLAEIDEQLQRADILSRQNDDDYVSFENAHVGLPDSALVTIAQAILDGETESVPFPISMEGNVGGEVVTSSAMQHRIASALTAYGLQGWSVIEERNMSAQASVNGPKQRVRVRAGSTFTPRGADRIVAHEVGGHVLRWANSYGQPEAWVSVALGHTVPTEEGLAAWREVEFGLQTEEQLRVYAARVIAVDTASREGLADVARRVAPYVSVQQAAEISIRSKRGLQDPNQPGGQTKDWGYLAGLLVMARLAADDPDMLSLMGGVKWPLEDAPLIVALQRQGRVHLPQHLPSAERLGLETV